MTDLSIGSSEDINLLLKTFGKIDYVGISYSPSKEVPSFDYNGHRLLTYSCSSCGDSFLFKSSLDDHITRKSLKISFLSDGKEMCFYNRCALIFHLKNNSSKQIKDISVVPLVDRQQILNGRKSSEIIQEKNNLKNPAELKIITKQPKKIKQITEIKAPSESKEPKEHKEPKETRKIGNKCSECKSTLSTPLARKEHFSRDSPSQCENCFLWCPNKCSLRAHERLHFCVGPYVCPECGSFEEPNKLLSHIIIRCQHFSRRLSYVCPHCKMTTKTLSLLTDHITLRHTLVSTKCSNCEQTFPSIEEYNQHDDDEKIEETLYKCTTCSEELNSKRNYVVHLENHLRRRDCLSRFAFVCSQCEDRVCESKNQLLVHLQTAHMLNIKNIDGDSFVPITKDVCKKFRVSFEDYETAPTEVVATEMFVKEPKKNHVNNNSKEGIPNRTMFQDGVTPNKIECGICGLQTQTWDDMCEHGKIYLKKGNFVCLLCYNRPFKSRGTLLKHLKKFHLNLSHCPSVKCASLRFENTSELLHHFKMKHRLFSRKSIDQEEFESFSSCSIAKRKREENSSNGAENWFCNCGSGFVSKEELKKHYYVHRTLTAPYLCCECGSNFVAYPSLERHLLSEHRITDGAEYLRTYLPEMYKEQFENNDVDVLEIIHNESPSISICPVCSMICPDGVSLKSHVKVHGMAFINSCRKLNLNSL